MCWASGGVLAVFCGLRAEKRAWSFAGSGLERQRVWGEFFGSLGVEHRGFRFYGLGFKRNWSGALGL